jgi:uncharacterized protein (TIGR02391 family)
MKNHSSNDDILHPRIIKNCIPLFDDGHYPQSAHEALKQVELALKEKTGIKKIYGVNLCKQLLGRGIGVKLRVPFGDDLQDKAKEYFTGVFGYYRNYAAHDGCDIDKTLGMRILIIASDLLDLIGASKISFKDIGGIDGLVKEGIFQSKENLLNLLKLLDGYIIEDDIIDGLFEDLAYNGFSEDQYMAVFDIGLIEYMEEPYVPSIEELKLKHRFPPDVIGLFTLTSLGKSLLE